MNSDQVREISELFPHRGQRYYVATKLRTDPLYDTIAQKLKNSEFPLLDLGCGLGLLAFYLRGRGIHVPIHGLDYDFHKIESARIVAAKKNEIAVTFDHHDAREGLPGHSGNVSILDILQFFTPSEQESLLSLAASRVAAGGQLIIRSGIHDSSWRFRITVWGDILAKVTSWMKAAPTHYPVADDFLRILSPFGRVTIEPLWGKTPFNNYLITLTRS